MLTLEQRLLKLEEEVKRLRGKSETWITAREVLHLTGRDKHWLSRQRENRFIKYRVNDRGGYDYMKESIPEMYLLQVA